MPTRPDSFNHLIISSNAWSICTCCPQSIYTYNLSMSRRSLTQPIVESFVFSYDIFHTILWRRRAPSSLVGSKKVCLFCNSWPSCCRYIPGNVCIIQGQILWSIHLTDHKARSRLSHDIIIPVLKMRVL